MAITGSDCLRMSPQDCKRYGPESQHLRLMFVHSWVGQFFLSSTGVILCLHWGIWPVPFHDLSKERTGKVHGMTKLRRVVNNTAISFVGQMVTWTSTLLLISAYGRF